MHPASLKHVLLSLSVSTLSSHARALPRQRACAVKLPVLADTSHSTPETAAFFKGYFAAKTSLDAETWVSFFNRDQTYYFDAAVGGGSPNFTDWVAATNYYTGLWGEGAASYPTRILGDRIQGAVVEFTDTPEMFGSELRILAAVDFRERNVTRQVDYWDGRGSQFIKERVDDAQYDTKLGLESVEEVASPVMQRIAHQLQAHLSKANSSAAAGLFSPDGTLEEKTMRVRLDGRLNIEGYLQRTVELMPYGPGSQMQHVLGNQFGGGYEWSAGNRNSTMGVLNGITALELDDNELITRCTILWESSKVDDAVFRGLAEKSVVYPSE